jgi:hypothetical protein
VSPELEEIYREQLKVMFDHDTILKWLEEEIYRPYPQFVKIHPPGEQDGN